MTIISIQGAQEPEITTDDQPTSEQGKQTLIQYRRKQADAIHGTWLLFYQFIGLDAQQSQCNCLFKKIGYFLKIYSKSKN